MSVPTAQTRRPSGWRVLVPVLVLGLPVLEVWLLIQLVGLIGGWWTLLVVLLGMVLGVVLATRQGRRNWQQLARTLQSGQPPSDEIASGGLILLGGIALVVPGLVTDLVGLWLLLPPTRGLTVRWLDRWARARARRLGVDVDLVRARMDPANTVEGEVVDGPPPRRDDPTVIRGEVEEG
ncbi:FxsA family protein [Desertihabitans brevis]|uniref:FxsA family protein n=1 Tax=Desertihabitans brevis TaxID=2268447 RepID=A0A367Z0G3_9ACTN|nr:FxsA family protein [Desertihabitans brevis]RCK71259.1 FxsA family protein [Desertihabitans brevis]